MHEHVVKLNHDKGFFTISTVATDARTAVSVILKAEGAPVRSVQWVRVRPTCDYCAQPATLYVKYSGDSTALCEATARDHYGTFAATRAATGKLGVSRFVDVPRDEWDD